MIVGGGPAGSATAIALLRSLGANVRQHRVVLLDGPKTGDQAVIGETLPPGATPVLQRLGCSDLLAAATHLECPGTTSRWGSDQEGHNDFLLTPIGKGYHLDRKVFDQLLLARAADEGAEVRPNWKLQRAVESGSGMQLECLVGGRTQPDYRSTNSVSREKITCDYAVDASGVVATLARRLGVARNQFDEVISLCVFVGLPVREDPAPARTLLESHPDGWWYAAQIPHNKAIISFCTDIQTIRHLQLSKPSNWIQLLRGSDWFLQACQAQFETSIGTPEQLTLKAAPSSILSRVVGERWMAVGDAASSYDSITSAGITKALQGGESAGEALACWLTSKDKAPLEEYQDKVFDQFNLYLQQYFYHYGNERRFARNGFWLRRRVGA